MSMVDIINLIKDKGEGLLLRTETFNIIKILVKRLVNHEVQLISCFKVTKSEK